MSKRVAFDDDAMWYLLKCVMRAAEGKPEECGPEPRRFLMEMELAGWLWLQPRTRPGYWINPAPIGCSEAHRWASRQAKLAAHEFGRVG